MSLFSTNMAITETKELFRTNAAVPRWAVDDLLRVAVVDVRHVLLLLVAQLSVAVDRRR